MKKTTKAKPVAKVTDLKARKNPRAGATKPANANKSGNVYTVTFGGSL